jgi:hypothetical protein
MAQNMRVCARTLVPPTKQIRQLKKRWLRLRAVPLLSTESFARANIIKAPFRGSAE